jgi:hypothetical protein
MWAQGRAEMRQGFSHRPVRVNPNARDATDRRSPPRRRRSRRSGLASVAGGLGHVGGSPRRHRRVKGLADPPEIRGHITVDRVKAFAEVPDGPAVGPTTPDLLGRTVPDGGPGLVPLLGVLHVEDRGEDRHVAGAPVDGLNLRPTVDGSVCMKVVRVIFDWEHAMFGDEVYYRPGGFASTNDLLWLRLQLYH